MAYTVTPKHIIKAIKADWTKPEIVAAINAHLEEIYPDPANRPTAREYFEDIYYNVRRWVAPDINQVVEALVLSQSTDPVIAAKYQAKLDQYLVRYEAIEAKFSEYEPT